ncbi:LysR family transcriptional regulator [uncultured Aliiroseovarius sp.]|uniref:LysR family transcriptional regulator n=1 Tax=uncultured Aliiroseovarius sp. TaxID=1658783 RepID=UPI00260D264F|nr:LysR family transcriptional regulator [uncultured Aliiroseovarius sp.]
MISAQLPDIRTFLAIVDHGSLSAAAGALGVKPPSISYRLGRLEKDVGTPLFVRTTRSLELTEAGQRLYERAYPALKEISAAVLEARQAMEVPSGTLRISLSKIAFQYALADHLADFRSQYPEIAFDLSFDDELVDLAEGGFHAGVRVGNLLDPNMVAVRLTGTRRVVHIASPEYLDKHGRPSTPEDLHSHECIGYRFGTSPRLLEWEFQDSDGLTKIEVNGSIIVNDTSAQIAATLQGLGIAWFGEKIVQAEIARGELEVILGDYAVERPPFFLYFPREYRDLRTLRALIDFLKPRSMTAPSKLAKLAKLAEP